MKSAEEIIRTHLKNNQGYLHTKELQRNSRLYSALKQLVSSGEVIKVKSGLYKSELFSSKDELQELCQMYPDGIICLYSAWSYYELSTDIPAFHCMAFPNKSKIILQNYPPIQAYFWSDKFYELEVIEKDGIKIYSLEKSICDAIKFRNKIGLNFMSTILKNYFKRKDKNLDELFRIAKFMKIENLLREYLYLVQ
jgi:predicted transcriptional regulator of viral defense system